jgi:2-polyprenyl-6-hydroxyphenyl methylase/3-demethylubiquinone-9 3-methyltransferase
MYSHELRAADPAPFDLVLIVDVLHHVPDDPARVALLADAAAMTAPGGTVLVKEWERVNSVPYAAGWAANFLVSGDRKARYMVRAELCAHLDRAAAGLTHQGTVQVGPWGCNVVHVLWAALPRTANRPPGRLPGESSTAQNVRTTPPVGVTQLRGVRPAGRMGTE